MNPKPGWIFALLPRFDKTAWRRGSGRNPRTPNGGRGADLGHVPTGNLIRVASSRESGDASFPMNNFLRLLAYALTDPFRLRVHRAQ
jgi:hypothetical protein